MADRSVSPNTDDGRRAEVNVCRSTSRPGICDEHGVDFGECADEHEVVSGVSDDMVERAARELLADYDSEFDASHLSWRDFEGQARRTLSAALAGYTTVPLPDGEAIARRFHDTYEKLAPLFDYQTREASAKPWEQVPENNRALMVTVAQHIREWLAAGSQVGDQHGD